MTSHPRVLFALALAVLVAAGCSGTTGGSSTSGTGGGTAATASTAATTAPGSTVRPARTVGCDGEGEHQMDDPEPGVGTVAETALPAGGAWTEAPVHPCPWALSFGELLDAPACAAAAEALGQPVGEGRRNGQAHLTWARPDGVQLDQWLEIHTDSRNLHALRAVVPSDRAAACVEDALRRHRTSSPVTIEDVRVTPAAGLPTPADLGLGFPAVEGYAADAGFVQGVDVTFTAVAEDGTETPVALRIVQLGAGAAATAITLVGPDPATLAAVDLVPTERAAAEAFTQMFEPR